MLVTPLVNKTQQLKVVGILHPLDIRNNKCECILMNFRVGLLHTQKGHDAIWVVIDRLTKFTRFIPMKTIVTTQDFLTHSLMSYSNFISYQ